MVDSYYNQIFKLVIIGDSGVGKTSLLNRFINNQFNEGYYVTIGLDFKEKTIEVLDKIIKLRIYDTAGQERFDALTTAYYRYSDGILLAFDTTDRSTFDHLNHWIRKIDKYVYPRSYIMLVGMKAELKKVRTVTEEEAIEFANEHGFMYNEISSKTGEGVNDLFEQVAFDLIKWFETIRIPNPLYQIVVDEVEEVVETPASLKAKEIKQYLETKYNQITDKVKRYGFTLKDPRTIKIEKESCC